MARTTKTIDLSAKLLGLEQTLEDDIIDLMGSWVDDTANNVVDNFISNSKVASDRSKLEQFIRNIIYDELKNIFGDTFVSSNNPRAFLTQLCHKLETEGFERNCRGCYYQVKNYGKLPHGKL